MIINFASKDCSGGGKEPVINTIEITANGTYTAPEGVDGYSPVTVNVPTGGASFDWTGTGYDPAQGQTIDTTYIDKHQIDIDYTKQKYAEWDPASTSLKYKYSADRNLVYAPKIDTSNVTDMYGCFFNCSNLASVPLIDTSNVTDMHYCFAACSRLTSIPQLDTKAVTNMSYCFEGCSSLTSIPQLDASAVTNMQGCFQGCRSLTDLGGFTGLKVSINLEEYEDLDNLTKQSLLNVIAGLATVTDSPVLKLGFVNYPKLTAEEIKVATDKGWQVK